MLDQFVSNVVVGHGAEQTAIHASLLGQLDGQAFHLLAQGFGSSQLLGSSLFQFGALGFELFQGSFGGTTGTAGGDQEVAGEAVLDLDHVTQVAQVHDFVEQNDLHDWDSLA